MRRIALLLVMLVSPLWTSNCKATEFAKTIKRHRNELTEFAQSDSSRNFKRSMAEKIATFKGPEGTFKVVSAFFVWETPTPPKTANFTNRICTTVITPGGSAHYSIALFNGDDGDIANGYRANGAPFDMFTAGGKTHLVWTSAVGVYDRTIDAFRYESINTVGTKPPHATSGGVHILQSAGKYQVLFERRFSEGEPHGLKGVQWFDTATNTWNRAYVDLSEYKDNEIVDVTLTRDSNVVIYVKISQTRAQEVIWHSKRQTFSERIVRYTTPATSTRVAAR